MRLRFVIVKVNIYIVLKQECILIVDCQEFHHVIQHQNFFDLAIEFFVLSVSHRRKNYINHCYEEELGITITDSLLLINFPIDFPIGFPIDFPLTSPLTFDRPHMKHWVYCI